MIRASEIIIATIALFVLLGFGLLVYLDFNWDAELLKGILIMAGFGFAGFLFVLLVVPTPKVEKRQKHRDIKEMLDHEELKGFKVRKR